MCSGCPAALHLSGFSAHHLVLGHGIAGKCDTPYISTFAGVYKKFHINRLIVIQRRYTTGRCKGKASVTQGISETFLGGGNQCLRERLTLLNDNQAAQIVSFDITQLANQVDLIYLVNLPLINGNTDIDLLAIRSDADLGRFDFEVSVTTVFVKRLQ